MADFAESFSASIKRIRGDLGTVESDLALAVLNDSDRNYWLRKAESKLAECLKTVQDLQE